MAETRQAAHVVVVVEHQAVARVDLGAILEGLVPQGFGAVPAVVRHPVAEGLDGRLAAAAEDELVLVRDDAVVAVDVMVEILVHDSRLAQRHLPRDQQRTVLDHADGVGGFVRCFFHTCASFIRARIFRHWSSSTALSAMLACHPLTHRPILHHLLARCCYCSSIFAASRQDPLFEDMAL